MFITFRFPVDLERYPDYSQVIDIPMDLTTVREELSASGYSTPHDFAKDVRLIFTNSKNYNTNKRSRVCTINFCLVFFFFFFFFLILMYVYSVQERSSVSVDIKQ